MHVDMYSFFPSSKRAWIMELLLDILWHLSNQVEMEIIQNVCQKSTTFIQINQNQCQQTGFIRQLQILGSTQVFNLKNYECQQICL